MVIARPFLITLIAMGYIITAIIELLLGFGVVLPTVITQLVATQNSTNLIVLGILQLILGFALYRGAWWAWWFVVLGAFIPIVTHIFDGLQGESWAWGTILWNLLVLSYMQSRDIQAFFGREAY